MNFFYYKVYHLDRAEVSSLWLTSQINVVAVVVVVVLPHCLDRSISALYYVFMDGPTSCCVTTDQSKDPEPTAVLVNIFKRLYLSNCF